MSDLKELRTRARGLGMALRKQSNGSYLLRAHDGSGIEGPLELIPAFLDAYERKKPFELHDPDGPTGVFVGGFDGRSA